YDYIVVGGGSAGGMAAMRLAKYGYKTLLIEAGPEPEPGPASYNITTAGISFRATEDPKISFDFSVKHYPEITGIRQNVFYPRVGGLGGCSLHHAQIEMYPQKQDFDQLKSLTGNAVFEEATFRNKYFKPLENNQYPTDLRNANDHGFNGWLPLSYNPVERVGPIDQSLIDFLSFLGPNPKYDVNGYINGKLGTSQESTFTIPGGVHLNNFTRMNFLGQMQMARAFTPLTILTDTFATKILFDKNKKAIGVDVRHGKYLYKASPMYQQSNWDSSVPNQFFATKEIIISGGTFMTPQLLMLSGIGDATQLNKFKIPVIANLRGVGKNLQDRYEIPYSTDLKQNLEIFKDCPWITDPTKDRCFKNYLETKTGPYLHAPGFSGQIKNSKSGLSEPDTFFISIPIFFHGYYRGYTQDIVDNLHYFTQLVLKARSKSKGHVNLVSSNPNDIPDINLLKFNRNGYEDMNALIDGILFLRNRTNTNVGTKYQEALPGSNIKTRTQIAKWIIETVWGHHVCCTAKLGADTDPYAVLDSRFRVRGVKSLRVVDMSAFPDIPGFFPNLFVHMLGDVVADFV
ncbi:alcohol oxidase, partial [Neoconidiobolus thromboides FSU 785]